MHNRAYDPYPYPISFVEMRLLLRCAKVGLESFKYSKDSNVIDDMELIYEDALGVVQTVEDNLNAEGEEL